MIKTIENKYNGVTVDITTLPEKTDDFRKEIVLLINTVGNKNLLWVELPIEKSEFIPVLTKLDFEFHHCEEKSVTLVKKMVKDAMVPTTKNFIVGVGAVVRNGEQILVVKDRFSAGYKLPGGYIDKNESIKEAVKREVFEETGIDVEFESILNIGHFRNGQFGASNLYIVCTAKPFTKEISINDLSEIADAKWINPEDFLNSKEVNNYNKSVVQAALENHELKLTEQDVKLSISGEVFY